MPGMGGDEQFRTTQVAVLEQEIAGIDIIASGKAHRRTHNRHSSQRDAKPFLAENSVLAGRDATETHNKIRPQRDASGSYL